MNFWLPNHSVQSSGLTSEGGFGALETDHWRMCFCFHAQRVLQLFVVHLKEYENLRPDCRLRKQLTELFSNSSINLINHIGVAVGVPVPTCLLHDVGDLHVTQDEIRSLLCRRQFLILVACSA